MPNARREGGKGRRQCELPRVSRPPGKKLMKEVVVGARGSSLARSANNHQRFFSLFLFGGGIIVDRRAVRIKFGLRASSRAVSQPRAC